MKFLIINGPNLNLLGTSGAGKTFTMKLLALRMRMRGIQCYILAPIKGHEFRRACNKIGGELIKIAQGSPPLHQRNGDTAYHVAGDGAD